MRLSFVQQMTQVQKQILAPRMIQSMEILQLPIAALEERIEQEMEENPVLEMQEKDPDSPEPDAETENPDAPTEEERELVVAEDKNNEDDFERLVNLDEQWPDQFEERTRPSRNQIEQASDRKHDAMANMVSRPQSLQDILIHQLGEMEIESQIHDLAERIIYSLDNNGYLPGPLEDTLDATAGPEELVLAERALEVVQSLDPIGVGARNLRECLLLQLRPKMEFFEQIQTLVSDHLDDLQHNRMPTIERRTGYSIELIQEVLEHLRHLNPKPGAVFSDDHVPPMTPDVFLDIVEGEGYKVRLEDGNTPSLYISPYYRQRLMSGNATDEEKEFIRRKMNAAQWLIESIQQRRKTLTRVAQAIVDHQKEFVEKGPEFIEPLKMQQIADKVGVHVTTVSRAVDDKCIQTPRGIFQLKRFFVGGTKSAAGDEIAWDTIRLKLQEIVDHEDKQKPYSDDELVGQLAMHGLKVARRTVTKYRKAMGIPSSRQRRDWTITKEEHPAQSNGAPTNGTATTGTVKSFGEADASTTLPNGQVSQDEANRSASSPSPGSPSPDGAPERRTFG